MINNTELRRSFRSCRNKIKQLELFPARSSTRVAFQLLSAWNQIFLSRKKKEFSEGKFNKPMEKKICGKFKSLFFTNIFNIELIYNLYLEVCTMGRSTLESDGDWCAKRFMASSFPGARLRNDMIYICMHKSNRLLRTSLFRKFFDSSMWKNNLQWIFSEAQSEFLSVSSTAKLETVVSQFPANNSCIACCSGKSRRTDNLSYQF